MKATEKGTPKTRNLREHVIRRRNIFGETSPRPSTSTKSRPNTSTNSTPSTSTNSRSRKEKRLTKSLLKSPVVASSSRYYLRSSIDFYNSPGSKTRQSLGKTISKSCKATPFRTPRLTSKISNLRLADNKVMKPIWNQEIKGMLEIGWKICYLSSMTNFEYRIRNVRNIYEAVLRTKILGVGAFMNLSVNIDLSSCLTQNPSDANAVIIRISAAAPSEADEDDIIVAVYTAWLISSTKCQSKRSAKVEWFPLMLYTGKDVIHCVVKDWLQSSFGCFVTPKMLQQSTMLWISAVWSKERCSYNKHTDDINGKLYYKYHVRDCLNMGNSVDIFLTFLRSDINRMYKFLEDKFEESTVPFIAEFHSTIQSFVSDMTCLPSDLLRLQKLTTSCFSLDNHGSIRLRCPVKIPSLLNHLTELLQEMLNCNRLLEEPAEPNSDGENQHT